MARPTAHPRYLFLGLVPCIKQLLVRLPPNLELERSAVGAKDIEYDAKRSDINKREITDGHVKNRMFTKDNKFKDERGVEGTKAQRGVRVDSRGGPYANSRHGTR